MNKHTPGPWHAALGEKLITDVYAIGDNKQRVFIAECATQRDALLIAAAPTMYEALQIMVRAANVDEIDPLVMFASIERAKGALAQAEGREG